MHIFFNFSSSTSTLFPISIHLSLFLVFYSYLSFNTVRYLACLAKPFIRHVGCLVFSAELEVSPSISISPAFPLVLVPVFLGLICIRSSITLRFLLFSFPLHFSCLLFSLLSPLFTPPSMRCWVAWILIFSSPGVGWAEGGVGGGGWGSDGEGDGWRLEAKEEASNNHHRGTEGRRL